MCFGGGAKAPDPYVTAQQQSAVNRDALVTAAQLNQMNQVGPFGSLSYTGQIGTPDRTQTVELRPELQNILQGQLGSTQALTDLANLRLAGAPGGDFALPQNPVGYLDDRASSPLQLDVGRTGDAFTTNVQGGPMATTFDPGAAVQGQVDITGQPALSSDFSTLSQQAQDAAYRQNQRYLDPQFAQQEQEFLARLSAQGITQGSDAYNQAVDNFARNKQRAYESARGEAIGQGFGLEAQLFGQNLAARQQGVTEQFNLGDFANEALAQQFGQNQAAAAFQNAAQQQRFGQGLTNAELNNLAQADIFGQNLAAQQAYNQAQGQQFGQGLDLRGYNQNLYQQNLQNQLLGRNQNINEAMAYLQGAPITPQQPTFQPFAQSTGAQAAPDLMGLAASNFRAQQQARGSGLGSIFGAVGQIGAGFACWVAREVYGKDNPRWLEMREWMNTKAPESLRKLYLRAGPWIASWIKDDPEMKAKLRSEMEAVLGL